MKKYTLSLLMLWASLSIFGQTIIDNPKIGISSAPYVRLIRLELSDSVTVLHFNTSYRPGYWIRIPDQTYIKQDGTGEKLIIKRAEGIPINEQYTVPPSGQVSYKLFFPPIDKSTKTIDYGEGNEEFNWNIYDIRIKPVAGSELIPQVIYGNWFNENSGSWEVSFFDTVAVYKSQLWKYNTVTLNKGKGSIKLSNKDKQVELFIKAGKKGTCMIGETTSKLESFTNNVSKLKLKADNTEKPYELPIFKMDSAIYCGYIKGYTPRIGIKTFSVAVNDIITGEQNKFLGKINSDGFFFVKFPLYAPNEIYVRSSMYNTSVYVEPGKTLFQMLDPENTSGPNLFMGELAKLNSDLKKLDKINSYDYNEVMGKILDMKPADYKAYCMNSMAKDLNALNTEMQNKTIGAKAYQVKKLDITYRCLSNAMEYQWRFESAYREKNKIPREQRTLPVKIDSLNAQYHDFLTNEIVNNPLALISVEYYSLINRLKYSDITRKPLRIGTWDIIRELLKMGYLPSEYEKTMFEKMEEIENSPERKAYQENLEKPYSDFFMKHRENIQNYNKETKESYWEEIEKYLTDKGAQLSDSEKQLIKAMDEYNKTDFAKKQSLFYSTYSDSLSKFHNAYANKVINSMQKTTRIEALENKLGIKPGQATDIMSAQDVCRSIVAEYSPVSDSELKSIQKEIGTPFISDYIAYCNDQTRLKIEANKLKGRAIVNDVPKTEADQLFDEIMKKYKGKVVYVDFWATWCSPCRSGIEQIKPLKEEMADENIAFVYITGPSSPQGTWANMIPDIKGEHYRVSNDEWNYLCSKFNVTGIPHYMLVGKNGEIINPHLSHMSNSMLKAELLKRVKE